MLYMTISSQENHNFSLFILSRTSDNTASQNIGGGPMHGPSPHLKFWGDRPPSPTLGLRPWSVILFAALLCAEFKCFELLIGRGDA